MPDRVINGHIKCTEVGKFQRGEVLMNRYTVESVEKQFLTQSVSLVSPSENVFELGKVYPITVTIGEGALTE